MKKLSTIFVALLLLVGCSNDDDTPETTGAIFTVQFEQSGDYDQFIQLMSVFIEDGVQAVFENTTTVIPNPFLQDDFNNAGFTFVTTEEAKSINLSYTNALNPTISEPTSMNLTVSVFRNGTLLETNNYTFDNTSGDSNIELTYTFNQ